jgi:hypothetical protein
MVQPQTLTILAKITMSFCSDLTPFSTTKMKQLWNIMNYYLEDRAVTVKPK